MPTNVCLCVFDQTPPPLPSLPPPHHTHTQQKDSEGNVRCNPTESEPQSDNGVECVLVLPGTETYTRGTTAVHSQRSCTVTPNQSQAQAGRYAGGSRRRERGRAEQRRCPKNRGAAHTIVSV